MSRFYHLLDEMKGESAKDRERERYRWRGITKSYEKLVDRHVSSVASHIEDHHADGTINAIDSFVQDLKHVLRMAKQIKKEESRG